MADVHTLHNLFEDELRDVYDAERQILKALPKIIEAVSDESLREGLSKHLDETRGHVNRLEQFAYSASHDLQEPIRNVAIYSEIFGARYGAALDAKGQQFLGFVNEGARRLEMLVKDLLAYTKATSGVDGEPVEIGDVNVVFEQTVASPAEAIRESGATATRDTLPPVRVHQLHLQQILQNLIGNAIKYRSQKRPRVHVSVSVASKEGPQWRFSVTDKRNRHRTRVPGENLRHLQAPAYDQAVSRHWHRLGHLQEARGALRWAHLGGIGAGKRATFFYTPGRRNGRRTYGVSEIKRIVLIEDNDADPRPD